MDGARRTCTEEDIPKLKSMAGKYSAAQIARELKRGLPATVMKAHSLRISLRQKPRKSSFLAETVVAPDSAEIDLRVYFTESDILIVHTTCDGNKPTPVGPPDRRVQSDARSVARIWYLGQGTRPPDRQVRF